jgi:hypothetical protein
MPTTKEQSCLKSLKSRRQAILRDLAQVERKYARTEQARVRLIQRIEVLERERRAA